VARIDVHGVIGPAGETGEVARIGEIHIDSEVARIDVHGIIGPAGEIAEVAPGELAEGGGGPAPGREVGPAEASALRDLASDDGPLPSAGELLGFVEARLKQPKERAGRA
jgi:hypothetical protein